jgi:hypothetical protein
MGYARSNTLHDFTQIVSKSAHLKTAMKKQKITAAEWDSMLIPCIQDIAADSRMEKPCDCKKTAKSKKEKNASKNNECNCYSRENLLLNFQVPISSHSDFL